MQEIATARKIALLLCYLKVALGAPERTGNRRRAEHHSAADLADALSKADVGGGPITAKAIDAAIRMHDWPEPANEDRLLRAIEKLCEARNLPVRPGTDIPDDIERRFVDKLPARFRTRPSEFAFSGEALGQLTHSLSGVWTLFYISPVESDRSPRPQISAFPMVFGHSDERSTSVRVTMISHSKVWVGTAFKNNMHLHLIATSRKYAETASFIMNVPQMPHQIIAGLGLPVRRINFGVQQPALATLTFGRKWAGVGDGGAEWPIDLSERDVQDAITQVQQDGVASDDRYDLLRKAFARTFYSFAEIRTLDPELHAFLTEMKINGQSATQAFQSLFLEWPH